MRNLSTHTHTHSHTHTHTRKEGDIRNVYVLRNFEIALRFLEIAKMRAIFEIACAILRLRRSHAQSQDRALVLTAGALEATS